MGGKSSKIAVYELKTGDGRHVHDEVDIVGPLNNSKHHHHQDKKQQDKNHQQGRQGRTQNKSNLTKQSSGPITKQQSVPALLKMPSANGLDKQKNTIKATSSTKCNLKCSHQYPWLIASGNMSNCTLADFECGRVIGRGLMGTVRMCKTKNGGKYFVLKGVRKESVIKHNDFRHIQNERDILYSLKSNFCLKLFGTFQDPENIYFALQFVPGGELFFHLQKKKFFPAAMAKFYATEIFSALEHIQGLGYVYRDLKPENVLLDEEGHVKIVDFGFSRKCGDDERMHTVCGTPAYLSPEQLDGKFTNGYTRVVDWWSFGILVFELLTGKTPFVHSSSDSHYEIFLRILQQKISFPFFFDAKSKELITQLCHAQLDKRLVSVGAIKAHAYFEMPWKDVEERKLIPPIQPHLKTGEEADDHYFRHYQDPYGLPQSEVAPHAVSSKQQFAGF